MKKILLLTATIFSAFVITNAQDNTALQITADDAFFCSSATFMDFTTNSVTFEAWVKLDGTQTMDEYTAVVDGRYHGNDQSKALIFKTKDTDAAVVTTSFEWEGAWDYEDKEGATNVVATDQWVHVAVAVDGDAEMAIFYIDGVATDTCLKGQAGYDNIGADVSWDTLYVGGGNATTNRTVRGMVDEVRVWEVARTAAEIADNMGSEIEPNTTGLLAYYSCNEAVTSTTLTDNTGSGNDLMLRTEAPTDGYAFVDISSDTWVEVSIDKKNAEEISVFPSPAKDILNIRGIDITNAEIVIYNLTGQLIEKSIVRNPSIDISKLQSGIYFIEINKGTNQLCTKFVKE